MFYNLEIMRIAQGMASHASVRQGLVARNIANADTPDYRATDIASFADTYESHQGGFELRATRPGHFGAGEPGYEPPAPADEGGPASPNGNTVSLEAQMVKSVEVRQEHELALAVYGSSLGILRASLGRR